MIADAINSLENDSDSEVHADVDANNILDADEEHASDIEESIKAIDITAGGKGHGSKQTTDKVMRLFINAHLLCDQKCCHHFHINQFFRTSDIGKLFSSDSSIPCSPVNVVFRYPPLMLRLLFAQEAFDLL
jgi:hypothetical protein